MKILLLTQRFPPAIGGVENHVLNLASWLTKQGESAEVFTTDLRRDAPFERLRVENGSFSFPVRRFRAVKALEIFHGLGVIAPSMIPAVLGSRFDLIHAHGYGYFPTYVASIARLFQHVPVVMTPHSDPGRPTLRKYVFDRIAPKLTLQRADRVIALTRIEARHLEALGIRSECVSVIPNGVNLEEFRAAEANGSPDGHPTVLFVGRIYPEQKGLEHLVRAVSILPKSLDVNLRVVGEDWGGLARLHSLAGVLGIEDRVTFSGPLNRRELIAAYAAADIFVLPSVFEPFGIVLLEAMASGLPIVASRVGGIPEVVEEGKTGLLVEPGDPIQLAHALESLVRDDSLREAMGKRGRDRASLFSWDAILPRIRKVYENVLAEFDG